MAKLSEAEIAEIRQLSADGQTAAQIAEAMSCPGSTVRSVLKRLNGSGATNGASPDRSPLSGSDRLQEPPSRAKNGHTSEDLTGLTGLLESRWASLSLLEKVRRLLA